MRFSKSLFSFFCFVLNPSFIVASSSLHILFLFPFASTLKKHQPSLARIQVMQWMANHSSCSVYVCHILSVWNSHLYLVSSIKSLRMDTKCKKCAICTQHELASSAKSVGRALHGESTKPNKQPARMPCRNYSLSGWTFIWMVIVTIGYLIHTDNPNTALI